MPICNESEKRENIYRFLRLRIQTIVYVGLKDIEQVHGNDYLKANIIISNLKNYMALSKTYIFFDSDNTSPQQRKIILDLALHANYNVSALVLDTPQVPNTIDKDAPEWSEGFESIYYIN